MFEKIDICPVCTSQKINNHLICKDYLVSGESFAITRCVQCGFLFTSPRPTKDFISKYYDSSSYISHSDKTSSLKDLLYKIVRKNAVRKKAAMITKLKTKKSILDYGCGTGYFLKACKKHGWNISGIEPNAVARLKASEHTGSIIHDTIDRITPETKYGVITLWHVLEHIHALNETVDKLRKLLEKQGRLIIAVPNIDCLDARIYKEEWAAYDVPRHLYHFSQDTMKTFLANHQLRILKTLPMYFDSYYVSLLSEHSDKLLLNYVHAFINGYKSNAYAKKHHNNYSSLIYIIGQ
jgi:2-polyprenyl-3-methyl-5-hydroxy-6-metoxy-1,4-benzoquinol methylase